MFFKVSYEVLGLRDRLKDNTSLSFHFDSPIAASIFLGKNF
jgi:hypothetical protein